MKLDPCPSCGELRPEWHFDEGFVQVSCLACKFGLHICGEERNKAAFRCITLWNNGGDDETHPQEQEA